MITRQLSDLGPADRDDLPEYWIKALQANGQARIDVILDQWSASASKIFRDTFDSLAGFLRDVRLVEHEGSFSLLYVMAFEDELFYYLGGNPKSSARHGRHLEQLPGLLRAFYEELHNGWYSLPGKFIGPLPLEHFFSLSELDSKIFQGSPGNWPDPQKYLVIFDSGSGSYLCLNTEASPGVKGLLWSATDGPEPVDFYTCLDMWTQVGLLD